MIRTSEAATTNTPTHLLWCGRWIAANWIPDLGHGLGGGWNFENGRDACDWLAWPEDDLPPSDPVAKVAD